jgi:sterol desaturase/sphingolipid hydroxylase (fatty acid hydroxylase superfamily)
MSVRELLNNATIIFTVMAIGALLETAVPMFIAKPWKGGRSTPPGAGRRGANLGFTALSVLSNWLLGSLAAIAAVNWRPAGVMAQLHWPFWAEVAVAVFVLDFSVGYLSHRTMHMWPPMWRVHQIHHNDPFVDVTTTYRTHPIETIWRFVFGIVPIWILGLPAQAIVIQRLLQVTNGIMEHANVRLWPAVDRVLSQFFVTPNIHKIHHSRAIHETNSNYANLTTLYDRLLGTYTPAERAASVTYGLEGADDMRLGSLPGLLALPFRRQGPRIANSRPLVSNTLGAFVVLMIAASAPLTAQPRGQRTTITGEVVDLWCYLEGGDRGAAKKECAIACAKSGNPIGILDSKGTLFVAAGLQDHQ